MLGISKARCGSPASSGRPVAVRDGATAQLLLPPSVVSAPASVASASTAGARSCSTAIHTLGLSSDQTVLDRQWRAHREIRVDAAGIGFEHRAGRGRQTGEIALRGAGHIEPPRQRIRSDTCGTVPLSPAAEHAAAGGIHLPETILGMDISLRKEGVRRCARADMRNAPGIAMDVDAPFETAQRDGASGLRRAGLSVCSGHG
jgi:hypothetical protein